MKGPTSVSLHSFSLASIDSRELHTNEDVLSLKSFFPEVNVDPFVLFVFVCLFVCLFSDCWYFASLLGEMSYISVVLFWVFCG